MNVCVRKCLHSKVNVCTDVCCCVSYEIMWICLCIFLQQTCHEEVLMVPLKKKKKKKTLLPSIITSDGGER